MSIFTCPRRFCSLLVSKTCSFRSTKTLGNFVKVCFVHFYFFFDFPFILLMISIWKVWLMLVTYFIFYLCIEICLTCIKYSWFCFDTYHIWNLNNFKIYVFSLSYKIPFWPKKTFWYVIHGLYSTNACSCYAKITHDLHIVVPPMLMTNPLVLVKMIYHKIAPIVCICLATCSLYDWICLHNERIFNLLLEP